jgi:hypothetical protein
MKAPCNNMQTCGSPVLHRALAGGGDLLELMVPRKVVHLPNNSSTSLLLGQNKKLLKGVERKHNDFVGRPPFYPRYKR